MTRAKFITIARYFIQTSLSAATATTKLTGATNSLNRAMDTETNPDAIDICLPLILDGHVIDRDDDGRLRCAKAEAL